MGEAMCYILYASLSTCTGRFTTRLARLTPWARRDEGSPTTLVHRRGTYPEPLRRQPGSAVGAPPPL